nr:unnamed protein product [Spirometra erinaceieuropaei]
MAPTKNRVGCESFFNVVHRKKDGIIVTSFNMDHSHDSLPPEKVDTEEVFKEHGLQDFRTLSPSSPKTQEQALVLRAQFKRLMQNGIFNSYADLMSTIRKYEKAANSNFRISHSSRLPQDHPAYSRVKYRYIYFACIHGGKCRGENMIRRTKSKRSGCKARFTAVKVGSQLHVKSVYMLHNHICNRMLASTYPRFRRSQCETNRGPTKMITRIRPSASRLPYLRSSFETDCKMEDLSNSCRRILPSDPSTMRMTEALHKMRGGCLPDFLYGEEGLEAMCFTTPALKTVFAQYAKVVQMDGTYRTNRHGMALISYFKICCTATQYPAASERTSVYRTGSTLIGKKSKVRSISLRHSPRETTCKTDVQKAPLAKAISASFIERSSGRRKYSCSQNLPQNDGMFYSTENKVKISRDFYTYMYENCHQTGKERRKPHR